MRICTRCKAEKPLTEFNRDCTRADGVYPQCKECSRRACRNAFNRHRVKHKAMKQAWKDENRVRHREINRAWREANPDALKRHDTERKAALKRATPPWVDRKALIEFRKNRPPGMHVDHIEPLRGRDRSGLNVPWNLQYLSPDVSYRKGNRTSDEFALGGSNL